MEGHGARCHPSAALAYGAWDPMPLAGVFDQQQPLDGECFATPRELREALLRALAELDAARGAHRAELQSVESEAARLMAERDELRRHCHSLLLLLHHHSTAQSFRDHNPALLHAMDEHHVTVVSSAVEEEQEAELEMALAWRLPEKGRLVEAVVSAGPLLQTLLLAGPLPR